MAKLSYAKAGVNIKKADRLVDWIKSAAPGPRSSLGGDYAGLIPFPAGQYKKPALAASADGVGTKLKLAAYFKEWSGLGQDLLAMCLNDLICSGAKPLFFMDYYACGKLDPLQAKAFLKGLSAACREADCPLLGGETAELPGLYKPGDMDCAGFCAGVVEESKILKAENVKLGDEIAAFKSSGFHSNGYSLLRKLYKTPADLKKHRKTLMRPTRLYAFAQPFFDQIKGLRAIAHITGGGLDNLSRILPPNLKADLKPWPVPSCFLDVKKRAELPWKELLRIFNGGLGLVFIVKSRRSLKRLFPKEEIISLGSVEKRKAKAPAWSLDFKALNKMH